MTLTDLSSVVYSSTATEPFGPAQLDELLSASRDANTANDLTGMLLYRGGRFIQVLEGPDATVRALLERIRRDPRHRDVRVLLREQLDERRFADWTMGYEPIGTPSAPVPEGFRDTFDDLENDDGSVAARAVRELTLWFRARTAAHD